MIPCLQAVLLLSLSAAPTQPVEEQRLVVALHDTRGTDYELDSEDAIHQLLEMPLNHLGMVVRRHDIRSGPPPEAWMEQARGLLTFFANTDHPPEWLWPWLEKQAERPGLRFVHFGDFGPLRYDARDRVDHQRIGAWLRGLGLEWDAGFRSGPMGIRIEAQDRTRIAFESNPRRYATHVGPRNRSSENRVWLRTCPVDAPDDIRTPIVTGDWGGIALSPWTARGGSKNEGRRWHLDPFAFFREALGLHRIPAPHPAMLNGRRMFFLHVDGDGFESLSTVRHGKFAAEVFLDEIIRRYPLPMTVSIIVAGLTDDYRTTRPTDRMLLARRIFAEPNVESGSHAILHPLRWDLGTAWYKDLKNYTYDPVEEAAGSIRFINRWLAPADRPCRMMLWSGESNPDETTVRSLDEVEAANINGGVFRWDLLTKSMAYVSPWGALRGDTLQVYAGAANENDFHGFFTTMPGSFAHIDETLERTGSPRILKPADIYCHFYSAEHPVRLSTLQGLIRHWGVEAETAPVFASAYSKAVRSAVFGARILRTPTGWLLRDWGDCRSLRIDGETRSVDFARSRGILGQRRIGDALYIHLAQTDADLVLADDPDPRPHVEQANHILAGARLGPKSIAFLSESLAARVIVVAGLPADTDLQLMIADQAHDRRSDAEGRLTVELPPGGPTPVSVSVP